METQGENLTPDQQPVLEPKNNTKLIIVVVVIIVIIAITAGVFGYLFAKKTSAPVATQPVVAQPTALSEQTQQSADETANWQTYTDAALGYQITFPETWRGYKAENSEVYGDLTNVDNNPNKKMGFWGDNFGKWKETDIWTFGIQEGSKSNSQQAVNEYPTSLVYLGVDKKGNALYCSGGCCVDGATKNSIDYGSDTFGKARCDEVPSIIKTLKFTNAAADETANWQTYTNTKHGYSFKYPKGHTAFTDIEEDKFIVANSNGTKVSIAEDEKLVFCCETSTISIVAINEDMNPSDWFEKNSSKYYITNDSNSIKSKEPIIFEGKTAYKVTGSVDAGMGVSYLVIIVKTENGLIEITQTSKSDLLDKILSTFNFTK